MSDNKKYYYLKMKESFFESEEMMILEGMENGEIIIMIYIKMLLRSIKNEGKLIVNEHVPYNSKMLAQVTRQTVEHINKALDALQNLKLIEVLDTNAIYMLNIENFVGRSSSEGDRKRAQRKKIDQERYSINKNSDICPPEKELEKELEEEECEHYAISFAIPTKLHGLNESEIRRAVQVMVSRGKPTDPRAYEDHLLSKIKLGDVRTCTNILKVLSELENATHPPWKRDKCLMRNRGEALQRVIREAGYDNILDYLENREQGEENINNVP